MTTNPQLGVFRQTALDLMKTVHGCLTSLEMGAAKTAVEQIQALSQTACSETERCMAEFGLNYCCAMLADSLAIHGSLLEAAAMADQTWLDLEMARKRRAEVGAVPRNNSLVKSTVLTAWSQIAWQQDNGTLSKLFNVSQVCEQYFALRAAVNTALADNREFSQARRDQSNATFLYTGVCLAKAAYRHAPRHLRKIVRCLNEQHGAHLMLGKNHFKDYSHSDTPWYFDFEICKGLIDQDLSLAEYDLLAAARASRWPLYGTDALPLCILLFWERERGFIAGSNCSDAQPEDRHSQGVA